MEIRKCLLLLFLIINAYSCGIDSDVLEINNSIKSIKLIFPKNTSEVSDGMIISDTESELVFEWHNEGIGNENLYFLELKNLSNYETTIYESATTNASIILQRDVAYSWIVKDSINNISATWTFINLGPWDTSEPPLAATAISPVSGASISQTSTSVNLIWKSEDPDDDIVSYDLFFGEAKDPQLYGTDVTDTRFSEIPVEAGKTYYWKIITKDSVGNESTSSVFNFTVGS
ncbi:hypothetical protein QSV08_08555 [Maribacter sp. BPC-D8]|uniref:hypothetical protein n=1 Tax=Maribacter sp. BPC-D8 TaxID=3053613 RepID=UPI002B47C335|nr:hypothetical protein [Maribacter sp. BPC-D8]WRI31292.1 hypothetical protein QSV08_08555 [Maribacter sp. BPC-D8]